MIDYTTKLNDQKVKDLRLLKKSGWCDEAICKYFGISVRTINYVVNRKSWPDVVNYPNDFLTRQRKGRKTSYTALDVLKLRELAVIGQLNESNIPFYANSFGISADTIKGAVWGNQQKWLPGALRGAKNRKEFEQIFRYHPDDSAEAPSVPHALPAIAGDQMSEMSVRVNLLKELPEYFKKEMTVSEIAASTKIHPDTVRKTATIYRKAVARDVEWFAKMQHSKTYSGRLLDFAIDYYGLGDDLKSLTNTNLSIEDNPVGNTITVTDNKDLLDILNLVDTVPKAIVAAAWILAKT